MAVSDFGEVVYFSGILSRFVFCANRNFISSEVFVRAYLRYVCGSIEARAPLQNLLRLDSA